MVNKNELSEVDAAKMADQIRRKKIELALLERVAKDSGVELTVPVDAGEPFPLELLPEGLRDYVAESAEADGVDVRMVALPLLITIGAAIGTTRRIQIKRGWCEPAVLWGAVIARSGSVKSAGIDRSKTFLEPHESQWQFEYKEEEKKYKKAMIDYKKRMAKFMADDKANTPPKEPERPIARRLQVDDATLESVAPLLSENPRGLLCLVDELRGWFDGMGVYAKGGSGGGRDQARWLALHACRSWRCDRKTDRQQIAIPFASVWVGGTIQPKVMAAAMSSDRRSAGLLARLLLVWPTPTPKAWTEKDVAIETEERLKLIIAKLLTLQHLEDMLTRSLFPRDLILSKVAHRRAAGFVNQHGAETYAQGGASDDLAAAWSKLEGYAFRFALIDHLVRWADDDQTCHCDGAIGDESLERGIGLARWFAGEAERIYAGLAITNGVTPGVGIDHPARLAEWLAGRPGGEATEREARRGLVRYRGGEGGDRLLDEDLRSLEAAGTVTRENGAKAVIIRLVMSDGGDGRDSDTWHENTGESAELSPGGVASVTDDEKTAATLAPALGDTSANTAGESSEVSLSPVSPKEKTRRRRRL